MFICKIIEKLTKNITVTRINYFNRKKNSQKYNRRENECIREKYNRILILINI